MGIPIAIMGESGSGKSASLRNYKKGEVGIINIANKPLPFKSDLITVNTDDYASIKATILKSKVKCIVIDDAQYLMANAFMRRAKETGFQKFTDIGYAFWDLIRFIGTDVPQDKTVYMLMHTERTDDGRDKLKTVGKMLDEKITLEGMFTIVLKTHVEDGKYTFRTKTDGHDPVKTPIGMFDSEEIDNDLKLVDQTVRSYYELDAAEGGNADGEL